MSMSGDHAVEITRLTAQVKLAALQQHRPYFLTNLDLTFAEDLYEDNTFDAYAYASEYFRALGQPSSIKNVYLRGCRFNSMVIAAFNTVFDSSPASSVFRFLRMDSFRLVDCRFEDGCFPSIYKILENSMAYTRSVVSFVRCGLSAYDIAPLTEIIQHAELDITGNIIGDEGGCLLMDALSVNTTTSGLRMRETGIGAQTCARAGQLLISSPHLRTLDLSANYLGDYPWADFAAALLSVEQLFLEELSLECVAISAFGVQTLLQSLEALPSSIQSLDLSCNPFDEESSSLLTSLLQGVQLENLALRGCFLSAQVVADLLIAVGSEKIRLRKLDLRHNELSHEDWKYVAHVLRQYGEERSRPSPRSGFLSTRSMYASSCLVDLSHCSVPLEYRRAVEALLANEDMPFGALDLVFDSQADSFFVERYSDFLEEDPHTQRQRIRIPDVLMAQSPPALVSVASYHSIASETSDMPSISSVADAGPAPAELQVSLLWKHNSCYMDSVLFCTFFMSRAYDVVLDDTVCVQEVFEARHVLRFVIASLRNLQPVLDIREAFRQMAADLPTHLDLHFPADGRAGVKRTQDAAEFLEWLLNTFSAQFFHVKYQREVLSQECLMKAYADSSASPSSSSYFATDTTATESVQSLLAASVEFLHLLPPSFLPVQIVRKDRGSVERRSVRVNGEIELPVRLESGRTISAVYRLHSVVLLEHGHYSAICATQASPTGFVLFDDMATIAVRAVSYSDIERAVEAYCHICFYELLTADSRESSDLVLERPHQHLGHQHRSVPVSEPFVASVNYAYDVQFTRPSKRDGTLHAAVVVPRECVRAATVQSSPGGSTSGLSSMGPPEPSVAVDLILRHFTSAFGVHSADIKVSHTSTPSSYHVPVDLVDQLLERYHGSLSRTASNVSQLTSPAIVEDPNDPLHSNAFQLPLSQSATSMSSTNAARSSSSTSLASSPSSSSSTATTAANAGSPANKRSVREISID
jgi:hypothetical protein